MVGSYMGRVFTVSSQRILTPSNLKGSAGSDWANHEDVYKRQPRKSMAANTTRTR